eukprot:3235005-Prymnesium_polylepis.2
MTLGVAAVRSLAGGAHGGAHALEDRLHALELVVAAHATLAARELLELLEHRLLLRDAGRTR